MHKNIETTRRLEMEQFKDVHKNDFKINHKDECSGCKNQKNCQYIGATLYSNSRLNNVKSSIILQYFLDAWPNILQIDIQCGILQVLRTEYKDPWIYYAFDCGVCSKKGLCEWQNKVAIWKENREEIYLAMESFSVCYLTGNYDVAIQCHGFESSNVVRETITINSN